MGIEINTKEYLNPELPAVSLLPSRLRERVQSSDILIILISHIFSSIYLSIYVVIRACRAIGLKHIKELIISSHCVYVSH